MIKTEVAVLGGGIIGSFIFITLTLNGINCTLLEKGEDVSLGATKANSGIIHAGYDCKPNTLKAKFNVAGNKMYNKIAKRLGEKIVNCGSLVVGGSEIKRQVLEYLKYHEIIYTSDHLYKIDEVKLQAKGIHFNALSRMDTQQMQGAFTDFCKWAQK